MFYLFEEYRTKEKNSHGIVIYYYYYFNTISFDRVTDQVGAVALVDGGLEEHGVRLS